MQGWGQNNLALAELERTKDPAPARFALAQIHQQQGRVEDAETFFAEATSLDPSLEQKIQDKDRFINRVSRSIKEIRQAKAGLIRKDQSVVKVEDLPVKTTKRILLSISTDNRPTPTIVALKTAQPVPEFLKHNPAGISNNGATDNEVARKPNESAAGYVRERLPITFVKGTAIQDRFTGKVWF